MKRKVLALIVAILIVTVALFYASSAGIPLSISGNTVTITVVDSSNQQPISGASVVLMGSNNNPYLQGTTNSAGVAVFTNVPDRQASSYGYTISVSKQGYNSWAAMQVPIVADYSATAQLSSGPVFTLQLQLQTQSGAPIPSTATASIQGPVTQTVAILINQIYPRSGQAFFFNIPLGTYTITVVASGYPTYTTTQSFTTDGANPVVKITLSQQTSNPHIQIVPQTVQRGQSVTVTGSSFVPSAQATILYLTSTGTPPVGQIVPYVVTVNANGAFTFPLSIGNSEPLGGHDVIACNGIISNGITISSSGSFYCALGQSNIVNLIVGVPVNLYATTDASDYITTDMIRWTVTGASPGMLVTPCITVDGSKLVCAARGSGFWVYVDSNGHASGAFSAIMIPGMQIGMQNFQVNDTFSNTLSNKVPLNIAPIVATGQFWYKSAGQPDWTPVEQGGSITAISPVQFQVEIAAGKIYAVKVVVDNQEYSMDKVSSTIYTTTQDLASGSHTVRFEYQETGDGPWNMILSMTGAGAFGQFDAPTVLLSGAILTGIIVTILLVRRHRH
jgi:hypothetical protein